MPSKMAAFGRTNAPAVGAELVSGALGYANLLNQQRRLGLMEQEETRRAALDAARMEAVKKEEDYWNSPVSFDLVLKDMGPNEKKHFESLAQLQGFSKNERGLWVDAKGLPPTRKGAKPLWDKLSSGTDKETVLGHYEAVYLDAMKALEKPGLTPFEQQTHQKKAKEAWAMMAKYKEMGKQPADEEAARLRKELMQQRLDDMREKPALKADKETEKAEREEEKKRDRQIKQWKADTQAYYLRKMSLMKDPMTQMVMEGKEEDYARLETEYQIDLANAEAGIRPSFLEQKKSPGTTTYQYTATDPKTGKKVGWDGTKWVQIQ